MMRSALFLTSALLCSHAWAAPPADVPPPPPMDANEADSGNEPEVTIIKETEQTVEEYRVNGRVYMIKVTPKIGSPYYLVDDRGDGKFARQESLDTGFRPPRWVIKRF
ncbi:MAG: DUF2782 domain-containing protein [Pseudomonadota bacterium]